MELVVGRKIVLSNSLQLEDPHGDWLKVLVL
jgi:hypothetical protein